MARIKYYYNTETCKYERVRVSKLDIVLNLLGFLSVSLVFAFLFFLAYANYFDSPEEAKLKKENEQLKYYYELLDKEMKEAGSMMSELQKRDDNVYRVIFEAEPIPSTIRNAGYGGSERYKKIIEEGIENDKLIISTLEKVNKLKKQMYIQTKSYDEILELANNKSKMFASIPAIQPISNKELTRLASGFGMRIHPIYKVKKMHTGVDFSAPRGTPIYATGDGVVKKAKNSASGYGNEIEIDHGYGYITKYAHMQKFDVKLGQKVKRGQCIGFVGNTGTSVAPHLHYEIIKNGKKINPVHYFFQSLTPDQYEQLLKLASIENQSLS